MTEHQLFLFMVEVAVLVGAARLGGELAVRLGVAQVIGELVAGIALGPSLFGAVWPGGFRALFPTDPLQRGFLELMAWLGVILLVLLSGFETRLGTVRRSGRAVVGAWIGAFCLPFALGYGLGSIIPGDLIGPGISRPVFALFLATAMAISAIPVIARILMDLGMAQSRIGTMIMSSAVADDTIGWIVLAVVAGLAHNRVDGGGLAVAMIGTAAFVVLAFTVGQRLVRRAFAVTTRARIPYAQATLMLLVVFLAGALTQSIHVHLVLGSFVGGILVARTDWRIRDREMVEAIRRVAMGFFVPFFFSYTGIKVDLTTITGSTVWVAIVAIAVACIGKLAGGSLGARAGGLGWWEALSVGAGLNARGAMELVIAAIGLSLGILTLPMYTTIVLIAVVTTLMAAPMLRAFSRRAPKSSTEQPKESRPREREIGRTVPAGA